MMRQVEVVVVVVEAIEDEILIESDVEEEVTCIQSV